MHKKNPIRSIFSGDKKIFLDILVILAALIAYSFFPSQNFTQNITKGLIFLVAVPLIYVKFILKRNLHEYGMVPQNHREGLIWGGIGLLFSLAIGYLLINFTPIKTSYPIPTGASTNFWFFMFYELVLVNLILFYQEFFYKGFVLNVFFQRFGAWSVIIQFLIYSIPLLILSDNLWIVYPALVVSLVGGWVAYKSRTFFYSYLMALLFLIIFDAYLINLVK